MILHCTFEELSALSAAAERVLADQSDDGLAVAAPPEVVADLEALNARLGGDLSITTLAEQRVLARAVAFITSDLRVRMDGAILAYQPAGEQAVQSYFEYANVLGFDDRLRRMGEQMIALIELMTGGPPTQSTAKQIGFPD